MEVCGGHNHAIYRFALPHHPPMPANPGLPAHGNGRLPGPGPVATVIGCRPYLFIARDYHRPIVTSGFEPLDLLQSIVMILRQLDAGRAEVENQYARAVPWEGNPAALRALADVFELRPYFEWRGLGFISQSALQIREAYAQWNSERRFAVAG